MRKWQRLSKVFVKVMLCFLLAVFIFSPALSTAAAQSNEVTPVNPSYAKIANGLGNLAYGKQAKASKSIAGDGDLVYHKPVTASNTHPPESQWGASNAVDDNLGTRWATTDQVKSPKLTVDFGTTLTFNKVEIDQLGQRIGSYKIQYWNGSQWLDAYTGGKASSNETATFQPVTGSKVRLLITDVIGLGPSIWEFKVFNTNHSKTGKYAGNNDKYGAANAIDANPATRWATPDDTKKATLTVNLGKKTTFNKVVFTQLEQRIKSYQIQYWNGSTWETAYKGENPESKESVTFSPVTGSKVRLDITNATSGEGPSIWEFEVYNTKANDRLSRGSRVLINKGLQQQAWITTDQTGRYYPSPKEWKGIHFTTATYYEKPLYNDKFQRALPNSEWSIEQAPYAAHLTPGPIPQKGFLSKEQKANINHLVDMGFGDEESFSSGMVRYLKGWYDLSRKLYPTVLVHDNQWSYEWSTEQLRSYVRAAKPDILNFDSYYFWTPGSHPGGSVTSLYDTTNRYRKIALAGYDGTGDSPIPFGQYTQGIKGGPDRTYTLSESQINIVSFATWTMGGKWTNMFRWERNNEGHMFYDQNGNLTPQYYDFAKMAEQGNNLGPYLVRLNSTKVRFIPGKHKTSTGKVVTNAKPSTVPIWKPTDDPYITGISSKNLGSTNNGLKGDLLIGYFEPLPHLSKRAAKFLPSPNAKYFMIMNGLTAEGKAGSSENTRQKITLDLDVKGQGPNALWQVNKNTGKPERVHLTHIKGHHYKTDVTIGGGKADLFFWK